jgi:hypothetical protein
MDGGLGVRLLCLTSGIKRGYMLIGRYHFPPYCRICMYGLVLLLGTLYPDKNNTAAFNAITTLDKS